jgi:hypothetical protein
MIADARRQGRKYKPVSLGKPIAPATLITSFRKGVATMQARAVTDPRSWLYWANVHGTPGSQNSAGTWKHWGDQHLKNIAAPVRVFSTDRPDANSNQGLNALQTAPRIPLKSPPSLSCRSQI